MTQNVVMYTVEVNTENPGNILLPYLTANVRFVIHSETNSLLVPNAALRWTPSSLTQVSPEARSWKPADTEPKNPAKASKGPNQKTNSKEHMGTVWLKEGEFVRPLEVKTGTSDGVSTAVASSELRDGQEVVTGEILQTALSGTQNPFIPPVRKR
jgi:HlyD family secretion protein